MKKTLLLIGAILLTGVGVYCHKNCYALWMPIGDATMVSYNHELNEDGSIHIYCPTHSVVEAAMGGEVINIKKCDGMWEVTTYNQRTGLTSVYSRLDSVCAPSKVKQGDTIGFVVGSEYLLYALMRIVGNDTAYINPAPKLDKNFK